MSNLNSKFNVSRGWPGQGAIEENLRPAEGKTFVEGQFVVRVSDATTGTSPIPANIPFVDTVENADTPAQIHADSAIPLKYLMVIQGNDQWDAQFTGKMTLIRGNFNLETERFLAHAYVPGMLLSVQEQPATLSDPDTSGILRPQWDVGAGALSQVVGEVIRYDSEAGILYASISI